MRKMFSYAFAGFVAASFGQIALADTQQSAEQNQSTTQSDEDKERRGQGWAKGWEQGKGHGMNDERHGGRHDSGAGTGSTAQPNESSESQDAQVQGERNRTQQSQIEDQGSKKY